ncbi:MAG TPA: twin-arginine translocation signal domain-containing protein [Thermodesulfobium narugense]|nr:twin-arginine translocation signal domain-containing protein [Thermodesulfobium narugense]
MDKFNRRDFLKFSFASAAMMVFDGNVLCQRLPMQAYPLN